MSGGRWVRQDNGDYQHFTDEEIRDQQRSKAGVLFGLLLAGGPVLMLYFNEMTFGAVLTIMGVVGIFIFPSETLGTVAGLAILGGIVWGLSKYGGDKKDEKKEAKTEAVSAPPTTQNNVASSYSSETIENEEVFQDNEEVVEEESVNEESIDESSTVDNSSESVAASSNKCYYVYGSVKELREQNILFDNNVNMQVENLSYFTEIDYNESKVIKLYSPRAEVRSYHPKDSYKLILDNNGNFMLNIINPSDFWKYSNLLVITTD